jgi:hypothetical protein
LSTKVAGSRYAKTPADREPRFALAVTTRGPSRAMLDEIGKLSVEVL